MAKYLTEDSSFSCEPCKARFAAKEFKSQDVRASGHKVLSAEAKLYMTSPPPPCPITSSPCAYAPYTAILNSRGDSGRTLGSAPLLTDSCKWNCGKGGIIAVSGVGASANCFCQGSVSGKDGGDMDRDAGATGEDERSNQGAATSGEGSENNSASAQAAANTGEGPTAEPDAGGEQNKEKADTREKEEIVLRKEQLNQALKCDKCPESDSCETLAEILTGGVKTSSAKLGSNYDKIVETRLSAPAKNFEFVWKRHPAHNAYEYARKVRESCDKKWSYAAHHVISGGQVVEKNPEILSLFKAFGYDINNAENCVWLIGIASDVSFKGLDEDEKNVQKYDCMAYGRMQWHGGHHQFKLTREIKARIGEQMVMRKQTAPDFLQAGMTEDGKPDLRKLECYAELLRLRLEKISNAWSKNKNKICPRDARSANPSPRQARLRDEFFSQINGLADEIRRKLAAFSGKPHRSFPWYVSMAAWLFAYNILHTSYIVAVSPAENGLKLQKFRLERHGDTLKKPKSSEEIGPGEVKTVAIAPAGEIFFNNRNPDLTEIGKCVAFCDNVIFFAMPSSLMDETADSSGNNRALGFAIDKKFILRLRSDDPQAELESRGTETLVWIGGRDLNYARLERDGRKARKEAAVRKFAESGGI